jgi:putative transposase
VSCTPSPRIIQSKGIKKGDAKTVAAIVRTGIQGDITALNDAIETLEEMGYMSAASSLERFSTDLLNYRAFLEEHWRRIRTTNMLERVNREIKRRVRSVGAFPSENSAMRLIGSILIDINEEWVCGRRYLIMPPPIDEGDLLDRECSLVGE